MTNHNDSWRPSVFDGIKITDAIVQWNLNDIVSGASGKGLHHRSPVRVNAAREINRFVLRGCDCEIYGLSHRC